MRATPTRYFVVTRARVPRSRAYEFRWVVFVLFLLIGVRPNADAQRALRAQVEAGTFGSTTGQLPFWLHSNQYGIVPLKAPVGTLRGGISVDYDSLRVATRRLTYGGGLLVVGNVGSSAPVLLPEAFGKVRLGVFELYAGRRRELVGLADSTLSTGSYAWSGNALPVPKVQLEIRSFTPLGFTKNFIALKGSFAHGWLGGRYVQHTLLHQKSIYIRFGKPKSRFKVYGGLNHQVVWGGQSADLVKTGLVVNAQLPSSFKDYLSIISGFRSSESGITNPTAYTDFDLTNRLGNHLGSVDIALELTTKPFRYYLYRQNPYETGALFYGTSLADGLNGLRIRSTNPKATIQQVLVEYLNTTSQGGAEFVIDDPQRRGRVDYFNHQQYRDGWSYQGVGLGTPFITPISSPNGELPYGTFTNNNRVQVWHVGLRGNLFKKAHWWLSGPVTFQSKLSYSLNKGTYQNPFNPTRSQFSGILTLGAPLTTLKGTLLTLSFSVDQGGLYPASSGVYIGLRKEWRSTVCH